MWLGSRELGDFNRSWTASSADWVLWFSVTGFQLWSMTHVLSKSDIKWDHDIIQFDHDAATKIAETRESLLTVVTIRAPLGALGSPQHGACLLNFPSHELHMNYGEVSFYFAYGCRTWMRSGPSVRPPYCSTAPLWATPTCIFNPLKII